jgi:predicted XRE-type DNA-binding protein
MKKRKSTKLTADLVIQIKKMKRDTELLQHEIAAELKINQGRVSEVLSGKRFPQITL